MRIGNILSLVFFIALSLSAGFIGSFATAGSIETWYTTLTQPSWTPPNWIFGPVWTTLYVLMGTAAYLVSRSKGVRKVFTLWFFVAHLVVNTLWSIVFFGLHELLLAVLVIVLLDVLILILIRLFWKHSHIAAYLLLPYLAWCLYATSLSIGLLVLN
ncbi:tryptophan-rich sensory protein [Patescibacteria group bacterium]|nr:tryptophan-rich sensory protein [Patescibacteria group bacterium]MBU1500884.1 tryptophan-rich sensory protein [Patescibacteria group bacterium]MBU2080939.1 tryptophan-rich sensory protein [Patescibacteria group bacterium]MBU2124044.1 tryptophan-rich sensory protein [Patescibacteria group bacterium]MBU2194665.1 tryptophan-rich sensory protein [Patescibacteria group bacterium]